MALVHWAKKVTTDATTRAALDSWAADNGAPNLTGLTVLIKPNAVCTSATPYTTNPDVLHAIVDWCVTCGAVVGNITIADRCDPGWEPTSSVFTAIHYDDLATALGCNLVTLGTAGFTNQTPAQATNWPSGLTVADEVLDADYVINAPVTKDHLSDDDGAEWATTNFTGAAKNWVGILTQDGAAGRGHIHNTSLHLYVPEIYYAAPHDLIVLDCSGVCYNGGPFSGGASGSPGIVVVTTDMVAADVSALAVLKQLLLENEATNGGIDDYTCWTQPQVAHAVALGTSYGTWITSAAAYTWKNDGVTDIAAYMTLMGVTNSEEQDGVAAPTNESVSSYLDLLFNNVAWSAVGDGAGLLPSAAAGSLYLSAHTADPGATGTQLTSEVAYTGYARVAIVRSVSGFTRSGTNESLVAIAAWGAMGGGSGGTITHFGIGTASSGSGHLLCRGTITPNITVTTPVNPQMDAGVFLTATTA